MPIFLAMTVYMYIYIYIFFFKQHIENIDNHYIIARVSQVFQTGEAGILDGTG